MKNNIICTLILVLLAPAVKAQQVVEYGYTPSHVFALWLSIHKTLNEISKVYPENVQKEYNAIKVQKFFDKEPQDVLEKSYEFTKTFNQLRYLHSLPDVAGQDFSMVDVVTPSVVYINTGRLLDVSVKTMMEITHTERVAPFYSKIFVSNKQPSDVYGLVYLANMRLQLLLDKSVDREDR